MAVVFPTRKGGCCHPEKRIGPNSRWGRGVWQIGFFSIQKGGRHLAENRLCSIIYRKWQEKNQSLGLPEKQLSFTAASLPGCAQHNTDTRYRGSGLPTSQKVPAMVGGLWGLAQRRVWSLLEGKAGHMVGWSTPVRPLGHADQQKSQRLGM